MNRSFFTKSDADLYTGSNHFNSLLSTGYATYGVSQSAAQQYTTLNTAYATAYLAATNPDTKNKSKTLAKNQAKAALKIAASNLERIISGNPAVTPAMRNDLGLSLPPTFGPRPLPTTSPVVAVKAVVGRKVTFTVKSGETEGKRGLPKNVVSAAIFTFVGEEAPSTPGEYTFQGLSTRGKVDVVFDNSVPSGSTVWVSVSWVGTRGEIGIASSPISFTLQGGAVGAMSIAGHTDQLNQSKKAA